LYRFVYGSCFVRLPSGNVASGVSEGAERSEVPLQP
jgi:hypothetical protein